MLACRAWAAAELEMLAQLEVEVGSRLGHALQGFAISGPSRGKAALLAGIEGQRVVGADAGAAERGRRRQLGQQIERLSVEAAARGERSLLLQHCRQQETRCRVVSGQGLQ